MSEVKPLVTLILGGVFDHKELGDIDVTYYTSACEDLQRELVKDSDDVCVELVSRIDYDAAQSELAALREELAIAKEKLEREEIRTIEFSERLAAAEQRNSALVILLKRAEPLVRRHDFQRAINLADEMRAAFKPTESGASDKCLSDGGTCGLGGQCHMCPHKESGASE